MESMQIKGKWMITMRSPFEEYVDKSVNYSLAKQLWRLHDEWVDYDDNKEVTYKKNKQIPT